MLILNHALRSTYSENMQHIPLQSEDDHAELIVAGLIALQLRGAGIAIILSPDKKMRVSACHEYY
jgi:hypothetical protein